MRFSPRGRLQMHVHRSWLVILPFLLLMFPCAGAPADTAREYQIKAVFLFNFTQFVEWPPEVFPTETAPLVIGVLGQDPFGTFLDETVRGETAKGRPLVVERYASVRDMHACHVLFISRSEAPRLDSILASLEGRSILTVSDVENFARMGGAIAFVPVAGRIRLRVNLDATKAAQLTLSSKLLRPAQIVRTGQG